MYCSLATSFIITQGKFICAIQDTHELTYLLGLAHAFVDKVVLTDSRRQVFGLTHEVLLCEKRSHTQHSKCMYMYIASTMSSLKKKKLKITGYINNRLNRIDKVIIFCSDHVWVSFTFLVKTLSG